MFGSDGQLKLFNPVYARLWELDEEFLTTQPHVSDIVDRARPLLAETGDWEALKARIVAATLDRTPRFSRLERSDDVVLDYAGVPLPDGSILFTYLDVSDGIRIERALRDRAEALEAADKLKSKFIENVSYELRTPLNTVIGFTEILKEQYFGTLNARQSEYAEGILDSSEHLLSLINNIIDLTTIKAGHMDLEGRVFDLHTMLASVLSLTRGRVQQQGLTLDFDCPVDIGELDGDERRIKQVVFNLLSNAIKFTPPGGKITLGARREPGEMVLWVADTGEGIRPEEQEQIFDKFYQSRWKGRYAPGAGLGLSLVKKFVELHGGRVELESEPGQGTSVTCVLPARTRQEFKPVLVAGA